MPFYLLVLSLLAGWLVNLTADTLPLRRSVRQTWCWPLCIASGLLRPHVAVAQEASVLRPRRSLAVWGIAVLIGWLAHQCSGGGVQAAIVAGQAWFLLAIAVIDLEHRLVLNRMLAWALPFILFSHWLTTTPSVADALLGGLLGFGLFWAMAVVWPGGMGMGDVKLAGLIGLMLGLPAAWFALWVGVMAGGLASLVLLLHSRVRRRQTMAYAPYLVLGAWTALYWNAAQWLQFLEHVQ